MRRWYASALFALFLICLALGLLGLQSVTAQSADGPEMQFSKSAIWVQESQFFGYYVYTLVLANTGTTVLHDATMVDIDDYVSVLHASCDGCTDFRASKPVRGSMDRLAPGERFTITVEAATPDYPYGNEAYAASDELARCYVNVFDTGSESVTCETPGYTAHGRVTTDGRRAGAQRVYLRRQRVFRDE